MTEELKIYWKLYEEYYKNDDILKNFCNLMDNYLEEDSLNILDIGCGQSPYLIDFYKNSKHKLFACDTEKEQINALKNRISEIKTNTKISYSINQFPNSEFKELFFSGVIVSNLLHFMNIDEAKSLILNIEKQIKTNSLLLFTAHSDTHQSNGKKSSFKHFYSESDFYQILPKDKYEYLYINNVFSKASNNQKEFLKKYIEMVALHRKIYDRDAIKKMKIDYIENLSSTNNITIVVRRK